MLEVFVNFINCTITAILGFYIIKKITKINIKFLSLRTLIWLSGQILMTTYLQQSQYLGIHTLIIYCINILVYKHIFNITLNESVIANVLVISLIFISDIVVYIIVSFVLTTNRSLIEFPVVFLTNVLISIFTILIFNIKVLRDRIQDFYQGIKNKSMISNIIFFLLVILIIAILVYNLSVNTKEIRESLSNLCVGIILTILIIVFINSKNNYNKLSDEYDSLFNYVQTFEDWIEKEQLNRHEYKNQLAVLRCLTKEKKVKEKIDEILEDNINIEGQIINQLKQLPKGGIKGLMYYKSAIAQKNKINLTTEVSIENKGILTKLTEKEIKVLCKLIGIYFDNAIEAAIESRKKIVSIEIYELKDKVSIVFSNTFKKHRNIKDRNKKGVSSKGKGRGNGLYFAQKLIKDNSWIEEKQDIIDNYYIQQLNIYK